MAKRVLADAKRSLSNGVYDAAAVSSWIAANLALSALFIKKTGLEPNVNAIPELLKAISKVVDVPDQVKACKDMEKHCDKANSLDFVPLGERREAAEKAVTCAELIVSYVEGVLDKGG